MDKLLNTPYLKTATPESIKQHIEQGADVNAWTEHGTTPLMFASGWNKNPDVITTLIDNGADVNLRDLFGKTPLMWASKGNENPDVITTLLKHGADMNAQDNEGRTAWDYIRENEALKNTDDYKTLKALLA